MNFSEVIRISLENIPFANWGIWSRGKNEKSFQLKVWARLFPPLIACADTHENEKPKVKLHCVVLR